jgi:Spy/CpxP family protein refolding chaperone
MTAPTVPSSRRPRGPLLALLVLLLALFVGGVAGVALDRHVLLPRMFRSGFHHFPGHPPPRDREFRNRFAKEVGLSAEQQTRIDSIMDRQGRELRAIRGKVQPQLDSIISRTRRELDSVLTPDQRKKAAEPPPH